MFNIQQNYLVLLAQKVLLEDHWPMMTILSNPFTLSTKASEWTKQASVGGTNATSNE